MLDELVKQIMAMDIPNYKKAEMIQVLIDDKNKNVTILQEGGNIEEQEPAPEESSVEEPTEEQEPNQAPGIVPTLEIVVGPKTYNVAVAKTEEQRYTGLSQVTELHEDQGMLFVFEEPQDDLWFTMADTSIDLDIIFMDEEGAVTSVHHCKAHDENPIEDIEGNAQFVLEVNINSGIRVGDELEDYDDGEEPQSFQDGGEFTDEEKEVVSKSRMLVLDSNGDVQMRLQGGERIVSMIKTRQLIKAAIKAYRSDEDQDYIRVAKLIFKELDAQDNRKPEYVEKPG